MKTIFHKNIALMLLLALMPAAALAQYSDSITVTPVAQLAEAQEKDSDNLHPVLTKYQENMKTKRHIQRIDRDISKTEIGRAHV